jgi:hypothetical protein
MGGAVMGIVYIGDTPYTTVSDVPAPPFIGLRFHDGSEQYIPSAGGGGVDLDTAVGFNSYLTMDNVLTARLTLQDLSYSQQFLNSQQAFFTLYNYQHDITKSQTTHVAFGDEFNNYTSLLDNFLYEHPNLRYLDLSGFKSLTSIYNLFLYGSIRTGNLLAPIVLPPNLHVIAHTFMNSCIGFDQPLVLPASLTNVGESFMWNCNSMTSPIEVNCDPAGFAASDNSFATDDPGAMVYTQGIPVVGPYAEALVARFPNRTSSPYRNLFVGT